MDITSVTPDSWIEKEQSFLEQLKDESVWGKIPLLNVLDLQDLQDGSLIRFSGMIQDMHNPEYYLERFEVENQTTKENTVKNGKYFDVVLKEEDEIKEESQHNVTSERHTMVVISTPGLNDWVHQKISENYTKQEEQRPNPQSSKKRSLEDDEMEVEINNELLNNPQSIKKHCSNINVEPNNPVVSKEHILNFPFPTRLGKACHLKIYKDMDQLKINDVCEFVGFLSLNPNLIPKGEEDGNQMEIQTNHPPPSLVPRIHCVAFKKVQHNNPLNSVLTFEEMKRVRNELMILLTQLMLGDALAAEFLLLHLLSEVYLRRDFMALGKLSLNLTNIPILQTIDYVQEVYKFIETLVPKSHYFPMTLDNMNDSSFIPKKDYDCNRLTSGILQLSSNTHLVLDETKLSDGNLNAAGVNNVKALASCIKHQKLSYDFNYYPVEYDCDIPFLIFSEGKSMLGSDLQVVLKPDDICLKTFGEIVEAAKHFLNPELKDCIRIYLTQARKTVYTINDSVEELVQKEFVEMRQKGSISADDLHNLLVLARLVCLSYGKNTLDEESWKIAFNLEQQRKGRLPKSNS